MKGFKVLFVPAIGLFLLAICLIVACDSTESDGKKISCGETLTDQTTTDEANLISEYTGCTSRISWPGNDAVYTFHAAADQSVTVSLTDLSADIDLLRLADNCTGTDCQEYSALGRTASEEITFDATAGRTYYFIADSQNAEVASEFTISVSCAD